MVNGATDERDGLQHLPGRAEKDNIILCTKMDRLGRNTADMIKIVDICYKKESLSNFRKTNSVQKEQWVKWLFRFWPLRPKLNEQMKTRRQQWLPGLFSRKPHKETTAVIVLIREGKSFSVVTGKTDISGTIYYHLKSQSEAKSQI